MIPNVKPPSPNPPKKAKTGEFDRKNPFSLLLNPLVAIHSPRSLLLIFVLCIQIILLVMLRSVPISFISREVAEQPAPDISAYISHVSDQASNSSERASNSSERASNFANSSKRPSNSPVSNQASNSPVSNQASSSDGSDQASISLVSDRCKFGRIYVYDVPKTFNQELLEKCQELNPWGSRCDMLINDGFGKNATGLDGIVPANLIPAWFWTDQFVSEIIFHNRMLKHKCRTLEPESATAFYVPFYAGLAVGKYLWSHFSPQQRDWHCETMLKWVQNQPYWNRSNGWDHFMTMGRITWDFRRSKSDDWGSSCIYMKGMRNITRLLIERNPWDYFDIGIPYPTGFHPRSDADILQWQDFVRNRNRSTLFCFAGATRGVIKNDFRGLLLSHCKNESASCRVVNCAGSKCSNGTSAILETFLDSEFCLQPRGDSFTRRSIFDCMLAGTIPVFFWRRSAYYQYQWFLPEEPQSYSVFIDRNEVKNGTTSIKSVLESYSREEVKRMREKVIEYIPKFVYAKSRDGLETISDAFDVAVDGVLKRFQEQEELGYKW
ncbi:Xyloglucan galactosyltransferase [Melia azedarach]|uniref:Xyloglucan galactosyltransferase n=2 Tax=Melia azedarach TaxID=155640 RepID=A0ACC1X5D0_MELAZ|nr:Xyloglucan galactosyltransferase [Melia azedarach]KAJ4706153.1 Xyloglucan galactosyltransferase [Melia azedarach]